MKIGIFTNNYLPNPYGVSMSIETFRREFEKLGHQVFIFAPSFPQYKDENKNACLPVGKVFRYPSFDIEFKIKFPIAIPYSRRIDKILENLDLDIIHSQHPNLLGTAAMKWARKKRIPLIFTWHTMYDRYTNFVPFLPAKLSANYMIGKAAHYANQADAVVAPTASIVSILQNWGVKNKIVSVATGVSEEEFFNPDGGRIRKKYQISESETILILITRITEEKNIEFLFDALRDILKENKKIKFILGGDGYLVPKLKRQSKVEGISSKVIFAGLIPREELKDYLAAGDILVDASKSETQGMHISEAMYAGLPVVAVSATGTNSLVRNNVNGLLVRENKREFSEAVEKLVTDANLRQEFGKASREIAKENFTSEICAKKMLDIYKKLILGYNKDSNN